MGKFEGENVTKGGKKYNRIKYGGGGGRMEKKRRQNGKINLVQV